ncbi:hypothetical protein [Veillonella sp. VA142]|uniref:hypothetical protein n=1 Tax=Veillonella sp. VA142 TaxID=741834 RepID=UPI000F8E2ECF|nr:hypothetical protein [Veillonella sp. VA142]
MTDEELYDLKVEYIKDKELEEVDWYSFYRDIFPDGSFERKGHLEDCKPNGLIFVKGNGDGSPNKVELVFDDLSKIGEYQGQQDVIMSVIGYSGKRRLKKNAYHLYGLTVDLDGQDSILKLRDTFYQMECDTIPPATYTVLSGHGLHLYYIFDEPIELRPHMIDGIQRIKDGLTELVWNDFTSSIKVTIEKPYVKQYQSISQGYRIVGSASKMGKDYAVRAWKTGPKWSLNDLESYFPEGDKFDKYRFDIGKKKTPLEKAKELWPEWYRKRIVEKKQPGVWVVKRDLYDWWLNRIRDESREGHRYYGIFTLATYAMKCAIPYEELRKDAFSLLNIFDGRTLVESNHFTETDIEAGLLGYRTRAFRCTIDYIKKVSGIAITKNKRNFRRQSVHLKIARYARDVNMEDKGRGDWINRDGRPVGSLEKEKWNLFCEWKKANPTGSKYKCIKDTGLSKVTVYKYWKL